MKKGYKSVLAEKKELKAKFPNANISIQYPAKLICDKRVVSDMFPHWSKIMRGDRLDLNLGRVEERDDVFDSDSEVEIPQNAGNNDVDMIDPFDALATAHEPVAPPPPPTPPPSLPMAGPSFADAYIAMKDREKQDRVTEGELYDSPGQATKSTEGSSTSRPPDQTSSA